MGGIYSIEFYLHLELLICSEHALVDHVKLMIILRVNQLNALSLVPLVSLAPNLGPH